MIKIEEFHLCSACSKSFSTLEEEFRDKNGIINWFSTGKCQECQDEEQAK